MRCFKGFIGLLGCGQGRPDSGVFVNSLPAVSLETIAKLTDSEKSTYLQVWDAVEDRAIAQLESSVMAHLSKHYTLTTLNKILSLYQTTTTTETETSSVAGIIIDNTQCDSSGRVKSNLQSIYVGGLYFKAKNAGSLTFKVKNGVNDEVLETIVIDVSLGWNTIIRDKTYNTKKLKVVINAEVEYYLTPITCPDYIYGNGTKREGYGFAIDTSFICSFEPIVCTNRKLFTNALMYLLGVEIQVERIYSDRFNSKTNDRKKNEELKDFYQVRSEEELTKSLSGLKLNTADECLECSADIQVMGGLV